MKSGLSSDQVAGSKSNVLVSKASSEGASPTLNRVATAEGVGTLRSGDVDPTKILGKRVRAEDQREATLHPPKKRIRNGYRASATTSGVDRQLDSSAHTGAKQTVTKEDFQDLKNHCQISLFSSTQLLNKCLEEIKEIQEVERDTMELIKLYLHNARLSPTLALRMFNDARQTSLRKFREMRLQLQSELNKIQHGFPNRPRGITSQQDSKETKPAWKTILKRKSDTRKAIEVLVQELDQTFEGYHAENAEGRGRMADD